MKKIFLFITIITFLASCEKWLDVNKDPNVAYEVNTDLILPAGQASLAVRLGGNLYNVGGFFAQYWSQAPEANQYNTVETFDLRTDFLNDEYLEIFAGGLNDLERIRTNSNQSEDWGNYLAATVLRAYGLQMWVDLVDKSPYTEAFLGIANTTPKWEDGKDVYAGLIKEIKYALKKVTPSSTISPSDMMLGSDLNEWIGFGNAMLLKLYMRERLVVDVSLQVDSLLTANKFMTRDVAFRGFKDEVSKRNPWVETAKDLNTDANHVATVNIIKFFTSKSDPRMAEIFDPAAFDEESYVGIYPALKEVQIGLLNKNYSRPSFYPAMPVYFYTMAELKLFIAEAELIFKSDKAAAKDAYEDAIDYGLKTKLPASDTTTYHLYDIPGSGYYFDVAQTSDSLFVNIMMQKWASLCGVNHFEAWCELRRTDIPKYFGNKAAFGTTGASYIPGWYLNPAKNALSPGFHYPNRLPYPDVATTRNANTPKLTGTQQFENKVWWDVN